MTRTDVWRAGVEAAIAGINGTLIGEDDVSRAMRYALEGGGKRLRPILCLAAAHAVRRTEPATPLYHAAAAIELIHTYSLIHDDLPCMDDDSLRRGRPTVHRVFGSHAAMMAGFALVPLACRVLGEAVVELGHDASARARAVQFMCAGAGAAGMVGGQVLDLEAEGRSLDTGALRRVHAMKTGALFTAALRIGGLLGGAGAEALDALGTYGDKLGMAFQITDDVLDETMAASALGKTPGKDRQAEKSTFVSLLGVEGARRAAAAEVAAALQALSAAGISSDELTALARLAADRDR